MIKVKKFTVYNCSAKKSNNMYWVVLTAMISVGGGLHNSIMTGAWVKATAKAGSTIAGDFSLQY